MSSVEETFESPSGGFPENLELPLQFELGHATLTLGELQSMQPGYLFPLDCDPAKPVTITLNGARIGTGDIVLVDGKLAIRLVEANTDGAS